MFALQLGAPGKVVTQGSGSSTVALPKNLRGQFPRYCRILAATDGENGVAHPDHDVSAIGESLVLAKDESVVLFTHGWSEITIWGTASGGNVYIYPLENE